MTTRRHQEGNRKETSRWRWRRNRSPQPSPPRARAREFLCGRATTAELGRCSGGGGAAAWRQRSAMRHMGGGVVLETPHTRAAALRRSSAGALTFPSSEIKNESSRGHQEGRDGRDRRPATTGSGAPCAPCATTFPVMPPPRRRLGTFLRGWLLTHPTGFAHSHSRRSDVGLNQFLKELNNFIRN